MASPSKQRRQGVGIFRRNGNQAPQGEPSRPVTDPPLAGPAKKDRPTPSRKEAEAARRQRVTRTMTKKEARLEASRQARGQRLRAISARDSVPEKTLLRDYIDARFSLGEFLLPSLVLIMASSFLGARLPIITGISVIVMYVYILAVLADCYLMWRGFKKVLAKRLPTAPTRGLAMYGMNRCIQIRRFRMPPPRIKRGEAF
jgi:Protein of unknown function (DUF3043)